MFSNNTEALEVLQNSIILGIVRTYIKRFKVKQNGKDQTNMIK